MVSVLPLSPVSTQLLNLTLELSLPSDLKDTDFNCFIQGDSEICLWAYVQLLGFLFWFGYTKDTPEIESKQILDLEVICVTEVGLTRF